MPNNKKPDTNPDKPKRRRNRSKEELEHEFVRKHTNGDDEDDPLLKSFQHSEDARGWD